MTNANGSHNLYQRLNAISAEVAKIKPTGKTAPHQGGQPAISIADVEDALRELFVRHGVVSGYSFTNQPIIVGTKGNAELWQADLNVWLVNADTPEERIDCRAVDIGSSPSAAVSFALKRFYRGLFHLAEESDETGAPGSKPVKRGAGSVPGSRATPATGGKTAEPAGAARVNSEGHVGPAPMEPSTPSAPASDRIARTQALTRLTIAVDGSGLDKLALREKAQAMFGKSKVDEMTAEEIDGLAAEVEALKRSTGVPV